jgi:subfamily B ATP-binding cassette protein MsbA
MGKKTQNISKTKPTSTGALVGRVAGNYVAPYWGDILIAVFFMAIAAAMTAGIAMLMQPVLDEVLVGGKANMVLPVAGGVFVTFFARGMATYAHTIIMNKVGHSIIADVQRDLFSRFLSLDLGFFHAHPSGQLISRVINDVNIMRQAVSDTLTGFGKSLLTLIFLVGVMFYQDWKLAVAAFVIFPFAAGMVVYIGRRLRKISGNIQNEMASLSSILSEIFQGIRQVKAYGMEAHERKRTGAAIEKVRKLNIKSVRVGNLSTPVNELLIGMVASGIIAYGGLQVAEGNLSAGQLVSFLAAFTMAYEPMKKLARLNNALQTGLGAAERVFEMLDRKSEIKDKTKARSLKIKKAPDVSFEDVSFRYAEEDDNALSGVKFTAKAGKVTALVGPSGGGKSTIINMIPRFYDALEGAVKVAGEDVRDVKVATLRFHIALVSQDITIFDDSVAANIAYGRKGATKADIIKAAKAAAAHDFIEAMDEGYDTKLGEHGVKLSGGQRQRLAIARAILRDAPLLLLDEATSALDNESEKAVQKALKRLEKGRTTIVIAHRLSTVKNADNIIVLDKGQVVETGTHNTLLKKSGLYAAMYKAGLRD